VSAAALLARLHGLGAEVAADGPELVVRVPADRLAPADVEELRHRKPALLGVLAGDLCRFCEGPIDWRRPGGAAYGDGTAAHSGCHKEAQVVRTWAAAARATEPALAADEGEVMLRGEIA
jgi:hypothetical protein